MRLNIVAIAGNLTRDPELKYTPSGMPVCEFTVAVNNDYKKNGEKIKDVAFIAVIAWSKTAELVTKYLQKGSACIVQGKLKQERWEKDGKNQSKTKVTADNVQFVGSSKKDKESVQEEAEKMEEVRPEDIPWDE